MVTPRLKSSFKVLNTFFNTLAYDPPRRDRLISVLERAGRRTPARPCGHLQDAHGPIRRGIVFVGCTTYGSLEQIIIGNPQLGVPTRLLNLPPEGEACPNNIPPDVIPP